MTSQGLDLLKERSDFRRCFDSIARRTAVMILPRTSVNSLAKASINVCWKRTPMVPWTITAASLLKKIELRQQTEVSAETITLLLCGNK